MPRPVCLTLTLTSFLALLAFLPAAEERKADTPITWKKTVLDKKFRAEGVAVGDVNRDGKLDVLTRQGWYEAPAWNYHEIVEPKDYGDGANGYSNCFACWTEDLNKDGWPDLIVIDFPGDACYWLENPRSKETHWKKHVIWHSACNETPLYADLFGKGQRVLIMGWQPKGKQNEGQMAYFTPGADPTQLWEMHPISDPSTPSTYAVSAATLQALKKDKVPEDLVTSLGQLQDKTFATPQELFEAAGKIIPDKYKKELEASKGKLEQVARIPGHEIPGTFKFSHGLGVGDVNGDGRFDVITTAGWWEQPADLKDAPWKFHPANLGDAAADMYAYDVDGDGKADVISSSAHNFGIWWFQQKADASGKISFQKRDLFPRLLAQTHALHCVDLNGDGLKDLVTGKRFWAHGPHGDAEPNAPAVLYWFEARKSKDGVTSFLPHKIDDDSGIGTQFAVTDVNGDGLLDVVTSNKKGVFLFEQVRAGK